eukprot:CAMPEP_0197075652 /NCGR_PEP_ID=MMETSP1384-20130603/211717_1 /TAXON_ID=29189 /ORGANISM="Ammonia sp." /LENGTH=577 /DNA_ID=CAMNT_0042514501 /DNA_START=17 /DNA_END=1750 /DNA_ORIENTATION=-
MKPLCVLFLAFCSIVLSEDAEGAQSNEEEVIAEKEFVVSLTEDNFQEFVSSHTRTLVEFYAPWCGHCKALAPKYEEAARILSEEKQSPTALAKVDATEAPALSSRFDIKGYPTLFLIEGGNTKPFDGGRETQAIVDWVLKHDIPAFTVISMQQFESSRKDQINLDEEDRSREFEIFAFVKKGSKKEKMFNSFADELRGEKSMTFYKVYVANKDDYKIVMRRNNRKDFADERLDGEFEVSYAGKLAPSKKSKKSLFTFKEYDLATWMHEHRLPFFINLDKAVSTNPNGIHPYSILYNTAKVPRGGMLIIRIPEDDDDAVQKLKEELIDTARELRAKQGYFIVLSSKDNERIGFTSDVNMMLFEKKVEKRPKLPSGYRPPEAEENRQAPGAYFAEQYKQQSGGKEPTETLREYRYQYKGDVDKTSLSKFVKDATVDGKVERWLRSADELAARTPDDIHFDVITANTFKQVALDKNSDVLVLYCTGWGRYCQPLFEEYNQLANYVKTYYKGKPIKITHLDCDENDVDDARVSAFPTMILYPGGTSKMEDGKLLSQEQRTVDDIIEFIDEHAWSLDGKEEL